MPFYKKLWWLILVSSLSIGAVFLVYWMTPFEILKQLFDQLSPDGNMESFTIMFDLKVEIPIGILGVILLIVGITWGGKKGSSLLAIRDILSGLSNMWIAIKQDLKVLVSALSIDKNEKSTLLLIGAFTLVGLGIRWNFMASPMIHDEAYSFISFASVDLFTILSDYHLPNNHILHTLFVFLSTNIFGTETWAIRLPAFLAGGLLIPASYIVGKMYFNMKAGVLAAGLVALYPVMILVSARSRGYSMVALITLILWALAIYIKSNKNKVAWLLYIGITALGFYTIPTMIYLYAIIAVWLLLSWIRKDVSPDYENTQFLKYLISSGVASAIITLLLYTPVFIESGIASLLISPTQELQEVDYASFFENFITRSKSAWGIWQIGIPQYFGLLTAIGFLIAWVAHRKASVHKVFFAYGVLFGILPVLIIQRAMPWARIWIPLLPLFLILGSGGLIYLLDQVKKYFNLPIQIYAQGLILALMLVNSMLWINQDTLEMDLLLGEKGVEELTADFLKSEFREGDMLVMSSPSSPAIWYYTRQLGIPSKNFDVIKMREQFERALVFVNLGRGQTVASVIKIRKGIDNIINLDSSILIYSNGYIEIYRVQRKLDN